MELTIPSSAVTFLAGGGGGIAIAWAVIRYTGSKFLDDRLAKGMEKLKLEHSKSLEALRHQQVRQIEEIKLESSRLLDRHQKLNQREFEILALVWCKVIKAQRCTRYLVSPGRSWANLDQMPDANFQAVVNGSDFPDFKKTEILGLPKGKRTEPYHEAMRWAEIRMAREALSECHTAILENSLFINPKIRQMLLDFDDMMSFAVHDYEFGVRYKDDSPSERIRAFSENGETLYADIQVLIDQRLWHEPAN